MERQRALVDLELSVSISSVRADPRPVPCAATGGGREEKGLVSSWRPTISHT